MTNQPTVPSAPDPGPEPLITQAKEDLAQKLSVPIDQIELLEVEEVVWPDTSLGCPQAEMMYAQVLTPGYRVVLTAMGETYEYHTDRNEVVIACDTAIGLRPIPIPPKSADDRTPWQPVDGPTVISP